MKEPIQIMLVEDHPAYREVIEMALKKEKDLTLASQFGTAEMALRTAQDHKAQKPHIILLDLNLPGMSGLDAIPWFKKYTPDSRIIILTQSGMEADVLQAIRSGAAGYLLKSSTVAQIKEGIRSVMDGGHPIDAGIARFILTSLKKPLPKNEQLTPLSNREIEILTLLADGLARKEIADRLDIGTSTVVTHLGHIYDKLNVPNAPSAVSKAYRSGILPAKPDES
ncbi:MAG: response regulator transcription factor [Verrucomicrobia bacterium]|nr:response regulator transcription factor [Verrucomicrobiota bacterium]